MKRLFNLKGVRDEAGNVLVTVALTMTMLLGITGVVIDGGRLYIEKSKLQKAMDAAVLAGAQKLWKSEADAIHAAKQVSNKNLYPLVSGEIVEITSQSIKVEKTTSVPMTFAKIVSFHSADVTASARAVIGSVSKMNKGLVPIAMENKSNYFNGTSSTIVFPQPGQYPGPGNVAYVDFESQGNGGGQDLASQILNGYDGTVSVDQKVYTQSGSPTPAMTAIDTRIQNDAGKVHCQQAATADYTCSRVIFIPIVNSWAGVRGSSNQVKIVGFAVFWIDRIENTNGNGKGNSPGDKVTGQFIKSIAPGEVAVEMGGSHDFGLYAVKLVE